MAPEKSGPVSRALEGFRIVFTDEFLAVIDKGWDLVVFRHPRTKGVTLVELLGEELAGGDDPERPGIVHRLDRGTSGLMIVAREEQTHADLQKMIRDRQVSRIYSALADGRFDPAPGPLTRRSAALHASVTAWRLTAPHPGRGHPFRGGRGAQARKPAGSAAGNGTDPPNPVHLEAIGHPVVGDATYGGPDRYGLSRQFLHSSGLEFTSPDRRGMSFTAPLPEDLATALEAARGADSL